MSDDLLPPNATPQERKISLSIRRAAHPTVGAATDPTEGPDAVRRLWDAGRCPVALLPWLAWAVGVDHWDSTWTEAQKRAAIRASFVVRLTRGTVGAIKTAIAALGYDATVIENTSGPFTFSITLNANGTGVTGDVIAAMEKVALTTKNARSQLVSLLTHIETDGGLAFAGVMMLGDTLTVLPPFSASVTTPTARAVTAYTRTSETLTVQPA